MSQPYFTTTDGFRSVVEQTKKIQKMREEINIVLGLILKFLNDGPGGLRRHAELELATTTWQLRGRENISFMLFTQVRGDSNPFHKTVPVKWKIGLTPLGITAFSKAASEARDVKIPEGCYGTVYHNLTVILNGIHGMWPDEFGQFLDELKNDAEFVPGSSMSKE